MAITRVASANYSGGGSVTELRVALPTGIAEGDLMVFALLVGPSNPDVTTVPSGWALAQRIRSQYASTYVYTRVAASEPASRSWWVASAAPLSGALIAYRGASTVDQAVTASAVSSGGSFSYTVNGLSPRQTTDVEIVFAAAGASASVSDTPSITVPLATGQVAFTTVQNTGSGSSALYGTAWDRPVNTLDGTQIATLTQSANSGSSASTVRLRLTENVEPNAPLLLSPANNQSINKDATNRFSWEPSDPDGDYQFRFDLRYRPTGSTTWTTVSNATPNAYHDFAAGAFAAGDFEWQVRTYDDKGLVGPWSSSFFFTAATPPASPSITAPISGETIGAANYTATWTGSGTSYQIRRVADNAGAADTATVYFDSGSVAVGSTRARALNFETNSRYEHVQVREETSGLWSAWGSVRVLVSYTPPAAPLLSVVPVASQGMPTGSTDALAVSILNPTPSGGQPAVSHLRVYRRATGSAQSIRVANFLTQTTFTDHRVASGVDYQYRAEAVAANGTASTSEWVGEFVDFTASVTDPVPPTVEPTV